MSESPKPPQRGSFPPTAWTQLVMARDPDSAHARRAREEICTAYWRPLQRYLMALGLSHQDAEDITQKVLADVFADGCLERIDASRGRMRHFFKAAARHAALNHFRHTRASKRGGDAGTLSLDELDAERLADAGASTDESDERQFDFEWAWTLFDRAIGTLEQSYAHRGKAELFAVLKPALISTDDVQGYAAIGSRFGVGEAQISIEIHRLRRRMAQRLREEVSATLPETATQAEVEAETRYLVQTLAYEPGNDSR